MFKSVILGAPASGKGTISSRIVKNFNIFHISLGDILRSEIKQNSKLGKEAKVYIDEGKLVPDNLILDVLSNEIKKLSKKNWLLDGFPRTGHQAEKLEEMVKLNCAINLVVPFDVIIDRVKGRWVHVASGRVYNESFNPPKVAGKDDITGEPLEQREDDKPETVKKRLELYKDLTEPILKFYRDRNILKDFHGRTSDEIWPGINEFLSQHLKPLN